MGSSKSFCRSGMFFAAFAALALGVLSDVAAGDVPNGGVATVGATMPGRDVSSAIPTKLFSPEQVQPESDFPAVRTGPSSRTLTVGSVVLALAAFIRRLAVKYNIPYPGDTLDESDQDDNMNIASKLFYAIVPKGVMETVVDADGIMCKVKLTAEVGGVMQSDLRPSARTLLHNWLLFEPGISTIKEAARKVRSGNGPQSIKKEVFSLVGNRHSTMTITMTMSTQPPPDRSQE